MHNYFRRILQFILLPGLLFALLVCIEGCKKNEPVVNDTPPPTAPVFTLDHTFIPVGGKEYIQFVTRCTSENIKLATATITDPDSIQFSYDYYSDTTDYLIFLKNESFTFPEDFPKKSGIWKFTFIGQRFKDNSDFTSNVNDTISTK